MTPRERSVLAENRRLQNRPHRENGGRLRDVLEVLRWVHAELWLVCVSEMLVMVGISDVTKYQSVTTLRQGCCQANAVSSPPSFARHRGAVESTSRSSMLRSSRTVPSASSPAVRQDLYLYHHCKQCLSLGVDVRCRCHPYPITCHMNHGASQRALQMLTSQPSPQPSLQIFQPA